MPDPLLRRFVVFHDYDVEGWKVIAAADTITKAVQAREDYIMGCGGGNTLIFEYIPTLDAYSRAHGEAMMRRIMEVEKTHA